MQPVVLFSYNYNVECILNLDAGPGTAYAMIYSKPLKIFKGMANKFRFVIKNQDQKPVNLSQKTIKWDLFDKTSRTIALSKTLKLDQQKGVAILSLSESDTLSLNETYYSYNLYTYDDKLNRIAFYSGLNYEGAGVAEVSGTDFQLHQPSAEITNFSETSGVYVSDSASGYPEFNKNCSLQTVAVYGTDYTGTFKIQATMANDPNPLDHFWFDVLADGQSSSDITLTSFDGVKYFNFYGIFRLVRFVHTPTSGTIDKLLYRF